MRLAQAPFNLPSTEMSQLRAETTWFHVFQHMIESGDAAQMGGSAFLIYCTIKSFINWSTGISSPQIELICKITNISKSQVIRHLKKLAQMEYVIIKKQGRQNIYVLREKIKITDQNRQMKAVAILDYSPSTIQQSLAELKKNIMSGDINESKIIKINEITININIKNCGKINNININPEKYHSNIVNRVREIEAARKRASSRDKGR